MTEPDLSDILVRMVMNHNHVPFENWEEGTLQPFECAECGQAWPCSTRVLLGINGETITAFAFNGKSYEVFEKADTGEYVKDGKPYVMFEVTDEPRFILNGEMYELTLAEEEEEEEDE